ncbi:hypothetical protein [Falsigemmobacter faecalis]|uniref:Uncharacterized protein n=1 Tax=Falsigemmobacter faecalis TaxID=2488730 RepID=A0A3P3DPX2_9RHOB|nr:hypothetical protein [Falsigemmobacter faecalis]RRH76235.1 hypothetical protein EG244_07445 [Falsigemmobacter faecalis]
MNVFATFAAATLIAAGAASANPIPAEGSYIPGPANYGEKISVTADHVFPARELSALGLSGTEMITVTKGDAPARISVQRGR